MKNLELKEIVLEEKHVMLFWHEELGILEMVLKGFMTPETNNPIYDQFIAICARTHATKILINRLNFKMEGNMEKPIEKEWLSQLTLNTSIRFQAVINQKKTWKTAKNEALIEKMFGGFFIKADFFDADEAMAWLIKQ